MDERAKQIIDRLESAYPQAHCELNYMTPLQLVTATVLSAQTTDKQVNKVTEKMFADHPEHRCLDTPKILGQGESENGGIIDHRKILSSWRQLPVLFHVQGFKAGVQKHFLQRADGIKAYRRLL